jgi:hypothetical protein
MERWLGDALSSHRFERCEAHVDGIEAAARADGQGDADYGEGQNEQYGKRYQSFQNRSPRR